jgi:hypothetical protein
MSETALGKRKASDNATNEEDVPFKLIPDVCWHLVAEFAVPPDGEYDILLMFVCHCFLACVCAADGLAPV